MHPNDMNALHERLNALADVFGKPGVSKAALGVWWETLREFPSHDVLGVLGYWAQGNTRMPAPADVWSRLNAGRESTLIAQSERERSQNRGDLARQWSGATPLGRETLRRVLAMLAASPVRKTPWHLGILDAVRSGREVPYYTRKRAAEIFARQGQTDEADEVVRA